ncbi:MAG: hypothetical protein IT383_12575 [Deltaproteobacteria bacterium]|nr:hypothetical protein [Deltaproteobacteria bacterium]
MLASVLVAVVVLGASVGATPVAALPKDPAVPASVAREDPPLFPLGQIKAGMRGTGYTVFESAKGPQPFDAVILGVMRGFLGPGEDLIIARLEGKDIERTGVIAGMSGSPVYIDGKLVGAVGYRFGAFTKDAIAGITPIERMMTASVPAHGARAATRAAAPSGRPMTAWGQAEPIAIPLAAAGVPPGIAAAFGPELERRGYGTIVGAGGTPGAAAVASNAPAASLRPVRFYAGGPISGQLVDGDLSLGAIGTVTWVKGDRFLAFGHPFLGNGQTAMPVSNAEIVVTVASEAGSWKMGQATAPVGRLTDDRLHAIAGTMGPPPPMVPLSVRVRGDSPREAADAKKDLSFRVFQHPTDTPLFVAITVASTLGQRVAAEQAGGTVDVDVKARLSTGEQIAWPFRVADEGIGFDMPVAIGVMGLLSTVTDQQFAKVELSNVDVTVTMRHSVDLARVVAVDAPSALVAGQRAQVRVRLQPHHGKIVERLVDVRVPAGLPSGGYQLVAAGQTEALRHEREGGLLALATDWPSYLKGVMAAPPPGTLSLYLVRDEATPRLEGRALPDLPLSLAGILSDGGGLSGGAFEARALRLARVDWQGVVSGESTAKVLVRAKDEEE